MQDRVGQEIPSEQEVDELVAAIRVLAEKVKRFTVQLTPEERRAILKIRPGGDSVISTVGRLADKNGVTLPRISTAGMRADLTLARRLQPLAEAATTLAQTLDDTVLEGEGEAWWAATAFYTALARLADADPELRQELDPVVRFFAIGRRKK